MSFDRLLYIDRLKEAGVDESVARAHADALREALLETVATKADLNEAVATLKAEISTLDHKIDTVDRKADTVGSDLTSKIEFTARDLTSKIELTARDLTSKIELTARDLTIRGASGLVIIAGLIVGLKLFG